MANFDNRRRHLPRAVAWALVGLSLVCPWEPLRPAAAQASKPIVHVFLQLDAKSSVVEKTLQQQLPDLGVIVFGRFRDFEESLTSGHPDAVLSIAPVLAGRGATASLQGQRAGKSTEPYVLASVNQPLQGSLAGKTIGVVDLLGRDGTQAFLSGLLKTTDIKIKRVAKIEFHAGPAAGTDPSFHQDQGTGGCPRGLVCRGGVESSRPRRRRQVLSETRHTHEATLGH
jgi:hypothetical protein